MGHALNHGRAGRRGLHRRARTSLLWALALVALLHPGLGLFLTIRQPALLDPAYGPRLTRLRKRMAVPGRPLSVVMLGSSRTALGFMPDAFETPLAQALGRPVRAFNFGISATGPATNLVELRRLLRDGVRPDLLLFEVLPSRLNSRFSLAEHGEPPLSTDHLSWDDLPLVERHDPARRRHLVWDWSASIASPWYTHRLRILARTLPNLLPLDVPHTDDLVEVDASGRTSLERVKMPVSWKARMNAGAQRIFPFLLHDFHVGGESCEALDEILQLCRAEGLPVAVVIMPEGPLFRSWYEETTWTRIKHYLEDLSQRRGVPLIDAHEWMAEDDFFDSHHLSSGGAAAFSARLAREGVAPLLAGGAPVSARTQSAHAHD
jgi:hypothetical protein